MSRFKRMSHTIWHCEYHIVWTPKYRFRVLQGKGKEEVECKRYRGCGLCGAVPTGRLGG